MLAGWLAGLLTPSRPSPLNIILLKSLFCHFLVLFICASFGDYYYCYNCISVFFVSSCNASYFNVILCMPVLLVCARLSFFLTTLIYLAIRFHRCAQCSIPDFLLVCLNMFVYCGSSCVVHVFLCLGMLRCAVNRCVHVCVCVCVLCPCCATSLLVQFTVLVARARVCMCVCVCLSFCFSFFVWNYLLQRALFEYFLVLGVHFHLSVFFCHCCIFHY